MLWIGQNDDFDFEEDREFENQDENLEESRAAYDSYQDDEEEARDFLDLNEQDDRAFEETFADLYQQALEEESRTFEDENVCKNTDFHSFTFFSL